MMSSRWHPAKKTKVDESTPKPNWLELPGDITANILQRLDAFTVFTRPRKVCSVWRNIYKDPFMWRTIDMSMKYMYIYDSPRRYGPYGRSASLRKMCRYAVDLSCGHLEDIRIFRFGTDELLKYIVDRTNKLRHLEIDYCNRISEEGICEVAKKLPLLEELYIKGSFSEHTLEVIGRFCPLLKSLTYSGLSSETIVKCDEEAFAIAKTMPGLRYLDIYGNSLSDVGLTAILDGCPQLESLDIQRCPNLYFGGNLEKRCQDQIKDLRSDFDKDDEYEEYEYWDEFDPTQSEPDSDGPIDINYGDYLGIL